jgi:hypothetical protein
MRSTFSTADTAPIEELLGHIHGQTNGARVAHARVLRVRHDGMWRVTGGRIDIARLEDKPALLAHAPNGAELLIETIPLAEANARLAEAFKGRPFLVRGVAIQDHGMDGTWSRARHTDNWTEYGSSWPIFEFTPTKSINHLGNTQPAGVDALNMIADCARGCLGYRAARDALEARCDRIGIYVWDYRGVFRRPLASRLHFVVLPADDPALSLAMVAGFEGGTIATTYRAPCDAEVPITGPLRHLRIVLRWKEEIVCASQWDRSSHVSQPAL